MYCSSHPAMVVAGMRHTASGTRRPQNQGGLSRFARIWIVATCLAVALPCAAQTKASISVDALRSPERAAAFVSNSQQDAYRRVMAAYAQEESAHAGDVALVRARCDFIGVFAESEELSWSDDAQLDYQACQKDMKSRFQGDAEVSLYVAEHRYGKDAASFAHTLLPASDRWTAQQRARLHAVLSRAYSATEQPKLAGEEALASVQLDPASDQLVTALRHLCDTGRREEAEALLAKAPAPSHAWLESQRLRLAAERMSPATALAELKRAEAAKAPIDPWLTARVYLLAGMSAKAADALGRAKGNPAYQSADQFQLRANVAVAQKDGKAASTALREWFGKTGITAPLLLAYTALLAHEPWLLFSPSLVPLALAMFAMLVCLACIPGLIAFPAHYRGIVRARLHKLTLPLFAPIGLRHMWLGFGTFLVAMTLVPMLGAGHVLSAMDGSRPMAGGEEARLVAVELVTLLVGGLLVSSVAWRLTRRTWLGDRGHKITLITVLVWALLKALVLWAMAHTGQLEALTRSTLHDRSVATLIAAATHIGGAAFAMLLLALLVPIYEELVFRGLILGGLSRHLSFGWSNTWQALLFALLHYDPKHFVFYFVLGALAGWLVRRTRGLGASIALHAANNAVACAAILLAG